MYKKYLETFLAISLKEADQCFTELFDVVKNNNLDETLQEIYIDFIRACCRYSTIRAEWAVLSKEERMEKDPSRTSAHDRVIDTHKVLARYMNKNGLPTEWYEIIGYDDKEKMSRKRIGDFACYIALFLGLDSR